MDKVNITVFDKNFKPLITTDEYISLIWEQVFNGDTGGFDLKVPATKENREIYKIDYYIMRDDKAGWQPTPKVQGGKSINHCQDIMIIETIEITANTDGEKEFLIGGSDITSILKRRIFREPFYISDKEYLGFFGKLGSQLEKRGLPIYELFQWYKLQGQAGIYTYGDFIDCQDSGYLNTYSDLAEPTSETVIRPDFSLNYPYTHADTTNRYYTMPDSFLFNCNIARIKGSYYWLADRYFGFYPEQGQIIHYQNGYYILLQQIPNTAEVTQNIYGSITSYSYWYVLRVPKPTKTNDVYEYDSGSPSIYYGTAINGSGEAIYQYSGISNAVFGDIYLYTDSMSINTANRIYFCSLGGDASTAKWRFIMEQSRDILSKNLVPSNLIFGDGGEVFNNINHNLVLVNGFKFPTEWDAGQTPFYALLDTGYTDLLLTMTNGYYLTFSDEFLVENETVTEFQLEKNIKHETYFDALNDVMKKYDTGLRLYPDSYLSANTKYHFAIYDGEDHATTEKPVIFSIDFENLKSSTYKIDNTEAANVAYISSKYPSNPADKNITEIELTTYTPPAADENIYRREVFIDDDISYRDGEGGAILQLNQFRNLLTTAANEKLDTDYKMEHEFDCEIDATNSFFKLNDDYFLGDKVLIIDFFGNKTQARVQEVAEAWDETGYNIDLKLKYIYSDDDEPTPQNVIITDDDDYLITDDSDYLSYNEA